MKSILFIAFLAMTVIGCDTPENSTGSDIDSPPDSVMSMPSDTAMSTPVDTSGSMPSMPSDTTRLP